MESKKSKRAKKREHRQHALAQHPKEKVGFRFNKSEKMAHVILELCSAFPKHFEKSQSGFRRTELAFEPMTLNQFKRFRGHLVSEMFGTQMPTLKLRSILQYLSTSAGVPTQLTYGISWFGICDYTNWTSIFDEFRFKRALATFTPLKAPGASATNQVATAIGVIDYDDASDMGSTAQARSYDTQKVYPVESAFFHESHWPILLTGIPDLEWQTTASDKIVAYWKFFPVNFSGTVANYGIFHFTAEVEFRQVS